MSSRLPQCAFIQLRSLRMDFLLSSALKKSNLALLWLFLKTERHQSAFGGQPLSNSSQPSYFSVPAYRKPEPASCRSRQSANENCRQASGTLKQASVSLWEARGYELAPDRPKLTPKTSAIHSVAQAQVQDYPGKLCSVRKASRRKDTLVGGETAEWMKSPCIW